jgi:large conductance mechanosensitive channel
VLKEFKEFAVKGNVVDMAVGIILGAAFTSVVKSLVDDLLMPPLGLLTGGLSFGNQFLLLRAGKTETDYVTLAEAKADGATVLSYGVFVNQMVAFLLVAGVLFLVVRWMNRLRRPDTPAAPSTKPCPFCKTVIHVDATRCSACAAELPAASAA